MNPDEDLHRDLERELPSVVARRVRYYVREFGKDTSGLLSYVYRTRPMLRAAPGEPLDFSVVAEPREEPAPPQIERPVLSRKAQKRRQAALEQMRERVHARLAERRAAERRILPEPAPRYDDVFAQGREWLDDLAGEHLGDGQLDVSFSEDIWRSRGRRDTEVS